MLRALLLCLTLLCSLPLWALSVTDYLGRELVLEQPARRVVALAPHIVENLYAAGAGDSLVAAVDYSDYPAAARALPRVGGFNSYSMEAILAQTPDLVVIWASGNGERVLAQLQALGIPVYVDEPRHLADVARSIRDLGQLTGRVAQAEAAARDYLEVLRALREGNAGKSERSVFYQIWHHPLQTVNGEHIIDDVIELCGGRNIFAEATALAPVVSVEAVLQRDPDIILASGEGEARPAWLDDWRRFPRLEAVRKQQLHAVPADFLHRHTPRLLHGAQRVCDILDRSR